MYILFYLSSKCNKNGKKTNGITFHSLKIVIVDQNQSQLISWNDQRRACDVRARTRLLSTCDKSQQQQR